MHYNPTFETSSISSEPMLLEQYLRFEMGSSFQSTMGSIYVRPAQLECLFSIAVQARWLSHASLRIVLSTIGSCSKQNSRAGLLSTVLSNSQSAPINRALRFTQHFDVAEWTQALTNTSYEFVPEDNLSSKSLRFVPLGLRSIKWGRRRVSDPSL